MELYNKIVRKSILFLSVTQKKILQLSKNVLTMEGDTVIFYSSAVNGREC